MSCPCSVTMKMIIEKTNKSREKKGKGQFSYQQFLMCWKNLVRS